MENPDISRSISKQAFESSLSGKDISAHVIFLQPLVTSGLVKRGEEALLFKSYLCLGALGEELVGLTSLPDLRDGNRFRWAFQVFKKLTDSQLSVSNLMSINPSEESIYGLIAGDRSTGPDGSFGIARFRQDVDKLFYAMEVIKVSGALCAIRGDFDRCEEILELGERLILGISEDLLQDAEADISRRSGTAGGFTLSSETAKTRIGKANIGNIWIPHVFGQLYGRVFSFRDTDREDRNNAFLDYMVHRRFDERYGVKKNGSEIGFKCLEAIQGRLEKRGLLYESRLAERLKFETIWDTGKVEERRKKIVTKGADRLIEDNSENILAEILSEYRGFYEERELVRLVFEHLQRILNPQLFDIGSAMREEPREEISLKDFSEYLDSEKCFDARFSDRLKTAKLFLEMIVSDNRFSTISDANNFMSREYSMLWRKLISICTEREEDLDKGLADRVFEGIASWRSQCGTVNEECIYRLRTELSVMCQERGIRIATMNRSVNEQLVAMLKKHPEVVACDVKAEKVFNWLSNGLLTRDVLKKYEFNDDLPSHVKTNLFRKVEIPMLPKKMSLYDILKYKNWALRDLRSDNRNLQTVAGVHLKIVSDREALLRESECCFRNLSGSDYSDLCKIILDSNIPGLVVSALGKEQSIINSYFSDVAIALPVYTSQMFEIDYVAEHPYHHGDGGNRAFIIKPSAVQSTIVWFNSVTIAD